MARLERIAQIETPDSAPRYELRVRRHGPVGSEYEIWQMPAKATPQVTSALRVAGLRGRNLELVEHRVLKWLSRSGVKPGRRADTRKRGYTLTEDLALTLGAAVPRACSDAQPGQYAGGGRRDRGHGARGSRLLVGHGDASQAPAPGADRVAVPADRTETVSGQACMHTTGSDDTMESQRSDRPTGVEEEVEGLDPQGASWGDYPIDDLLIRHENRTIHDVIRRINQGNYLMNPDFQRDFIWLEDKQSKLIESVIMRIPLPVFYMAEDDEGRMVVVDGLQRLSTFQQFMKGDLELRLPDRKELNGKKFSDLSSKLKNRVEDFNLIFYTIDAKVPERARLDIFERVNSGEPLTRQQMRNSLFMGSATRFLKNESRKDIFLQATGKSLNQNTMRDQEFVNRFCAFQILDHKEYRGDMDELLANCLRKMNTMEKAELSRLSVEFHWGPR